jgi:hypothetical protein
MEALCCLTLCMVAFLGTIPVAWLVFMRGRFGRSARHDALQEALGAGWTSPNKGMFHGVVSGRRVQVSLTMVNNTSGGWRPGVRLEAAVERPALRGSWYTPRRGKAPSEGFEAVFRGDAPLHTLAAGDREALMQLYDHSHAFVDLKQVHAKPLGAPAHLCIVVPEAVPEASLVQSKLEGLVAVAARLDRP